MFTIHAQAARKHSTRQPPCRMRAHMLPWAAAQPKWRSGLLQQLEVEAGATPQHLGLWRSWMTSIRKYRARLRRWHQVGSCELAHLAV